MSGVKCLVSYVTYHMSLPQPYGFQKYGICNGIYLPKSYDHLTLCFASLCPLPSRGPLSFFGQFLKFIKFSAKSMLASLSPASSSNFQSKLQEKRHNIFKKDLYFQYCGLKESLKLPLCKTTIVPL